jgi:hypothetical protein
MSGVFDVKSLKQGKLEFVAYEPESRGMSVEANCPIGRCWLGSTSLRCGEGE